MVGGKQRDPECLVPDQETFQSSIFRHALIVVPDRSRPAYAVHDVLLGKVAGTAQGLLPASEKCVDKIVRIVVIGAPDTAEGHEFSVGAQIHPAFRIIAHNGDLQSDCLQILPDHIEQIELPHAGRGIGSQFNAGPDVFPGSFQISSGIFPKYDHDQLQK